MRRLVACLLVLLCLPLTALAATEGSSPAMVEGGPEGGASTTVISYEEAMYNIHLNTYAHATAYAATGQWQMVYHTVIWYGVIVTMIAYDEGAQKVGP